MGNSQSTTEKFKKKLEKRLQLQKVPFYPSPNTTVIKTKSKRPTKPALQQAQRLDLHAEPQGKNQSKINASDGRTQVLTTSQWPNSVHGVIAFKRNRITTWGTGILIGPHIVLTAGHNLYDREAKAKTDVKSLQFLPGMNGQSLPFGVIEVEQYFVSPNYIKEGKEDYGILILKRPIGEVTGYFGLACLESEEIKTKRINVTGYPSDKVASKPNVYEMWGMGGEASHVDQNRGIINYLIDTESGQSGSGVWYQEGEEYYVCGVHVAGTQFVNTATLLTRAMYKQIHTWVEQVGFREFLFQMKGSKELKFEDQEINTECLSILVQYELGDLEILRLDCKEIGSRGAKVLAQNTSWIKLSHLNLTFSNIGAEGAKTLAQNTSWINLSQLHLGWNQIGADGAKALAQNTSWINLSLLNLWSNEIGVDGAKALAQNTSWINLSQLILRLNNIGAEGALALAQNTSWINFSQLHLTKDEIDPEGAIALEQNKTWKKGLKILE